MENLAFIVIIKNNKPQIFVTQHYLSYFLFLKSCFRVLQVPSYLSSEKSIHIDVQDTIQYKTKQTMKEKKIIT